MANDLQGLGSAPLFSDLLYYYADIAQSPKFKLERAAQLTRFDGTTAQLNSFYNDFALPLSFTVELMRLEQIFNFLSFYFDRKGKLERFWLPRPANCFSLQGSQTVGNTEIKIKNLLYTFRGYERIVLVTRDLDIITREVTSATEVDGGANVTVAFAEALDRTINPEDIILFSDLLLVRFDVDRLNVKYRSPVSASCSVSLVTLLEYSEV